MNNIENSADIIFTVADKNQERKKKTNMWYIVIAVVFLIAAVAVTAVIVSNRNKNNAVIPEVSAGDSEDKAEDIPVDTTPVSAADDVDFTFENVSRDFLEELELHQEATSSVDATKAEAAPLTTAPQTTEKKPQVNVTEYVEKTTHKTEDEVQTDDSYIELIDAFFGCRFYMDGTMVSGGSETPLELAVNGDDMHIFSEMEGMDIAILKLNGKLYLMNPDKKKYIVIDAALKKMIGLDEESLTFDFMKIKFDSKSPSSVTGATFNDKEAVCYGYKKSDSAVDFIAADGEIKQIIQYGKDGEISSAITLDEFSCEFPSEMFDFKGYSKTNIISFLSDMM